MNKCISPVSPLHLIILPKESQIADGPAKHLDTLFTIKFKMHNDDRFPSLLHSMMVFNCTYPQYTNHLIAYEIFLKIGAVDNKEIEKVCPIAQLYLYLPPPEGWVL
jgi:hypothetical protein